MSQRSLLLWFLICLTIAHLFAIVWVIVAFATLPASDLAHGQMPLVRPILTTAAIIASISAVVFYPPTYLALRDCHLLWSTAILTGIVVTEIVIVTPINAAWGFVGSYLAFGLGLVVARHFGRHVAPRGSQGSPQFGLRGLTIVVSIFAVLLAFVAWKRPNRQPHELLQAAYHGDLPTVTALLAKGVNINTRDGWNSTALMYAASQGNLEIVKLLLKAGADINERSRMQRTPLMHAAANGEIDVVRYLIEEGANQDMVDTAGKSALRIAAENGQEKTQKFLEEERKKTR